MIGIDMNVSDAEKKLMKLRSNIEKTEKELEDATKKRDKAQKGIDAGALDAEKKKLSEMKVAQEKNASLQKKISAIVADTSYYHDKIAKSERGRTDALERQRISAQSIAALEEKIQALKSSPDADAERIKGEESTLSSIRREWENARTAVANYTASISVAQKSLDKLDAEAQKLANEIPQTVPTNSQIKAQEERIKQLQSEWNKALSSVERYEVQINDASARLTAQIDKAGDLQRKINEAAAEAAKMEVSDQRIVDLANDRLALEEKLERLKERGIGLGYKDYDSIIAQIAEIDSQLKSYQAEVSKTQVQRQIEAEVTKKVMDRAMQSAEKLTAKMQAVVEKERAAAEEAARLQEIADNAEVSDQRIVRLNQELATLKERQADLKKADRGTGYKEFDQNAARIAEITAEIKNYQKGQKETLQQVAETEKNISGELQNTEISNQHIVDLNRELLELKKRQKDLEWAGAGLGHTEYDANISRMESINKELKDYKDSLNVGVSESPIDRTALAAQKMNAVLSNSKKLLKSIGSAGTAAGKAAGNAIQFVIRKAGTLVKKAVSFAKNLNVFAKLSDSLSDKFKHLGSTIKSALVFSVIYKGLSLVREQMGAYLNVNTQFTTALRRLQGVLLTAFQPIYEVVVPALTTLINILARAAATVTQFFASLFGTTAKQAQTNAKDLYEQANATTAAGDAAEEAAKQLAGFDEINKLEGNKSAGGGGSASVDTGPLFDYEYDETPFDSWGEAFSAFLDKLLNGIPKLRDAFRNFADWLNDWSKKVYDMFTFPGVLEKVKQLGRDLADALNDLVNWIDWYQMGQALGAGLNLALNFLTSFIYEFDWMNLGRKLAEFVNGLVHEIDWYEFGRLLWAGFKIGLETLAGFLLGLDMPQLAEAASNIAIGFFTEMKNTIDKIEWYEIGEQIRTFLENIRWEEILDSVFGAIKSAFHASSDFFSGLLGEELKRELTDMLITICEALLVIGALLALSGANVPLGMALMAAGAASLATAAVLDWEYVLGNIQSIITKVLAILGGALLAIGAILLFSKANVLLGLGLMAAGAVSLAASVAINWDFLPNTISGIVSKIATILGGALLAIGAILAFSNANLPLGIGLMVAGAASLAAAVAINWDAITATLQGTVGKITALVSGALLALGAVILFSSGNIPLGLGLLVAGAAGLATTIAANWESIVTTMQGTVGKITAIVSAALLALGAVLLFTGAGIPLGLGLIAAGAAGLAASIAANWETIQPKVQGALDAVKGIASASMLALGVVLLFTGAGIPLGLGLIGIGAAGLASAIDPNWGGILESLRGTIRDIENWWENGPAKYFTLGYWKEKGKGIVDGFMEGLNGIFSFLRDVKDAIVNAFSTTSISGATGGSRYSGMRPSFSSRAAVQSLPDMANFTIPKLAQGAVIPPNREFLAVLGDQRSGNNLEGPESSFEAAVARGIRAAGGLGGNRPITVILQVDRRELGRVVYEVNNEENQRVGVRLVEAHT